MRNSLVYVILVLCVVSFLPNSACADIKDGLISVWSLNEGEGNFTEDQVGDNHGLLLEGGASGMPPTWVLPGKFGNSHLEFDTGAAGGDVPQGVLLNTDGVLDTLTVPESLMPTTGVSVSAWVKLTSFAYYAPVIYTAMWTGDTQSGYMMHTFEGSFNWWLKAENSSYGICRIENCNTDQWYHLVGTYDSTLDRDQLKFYLDGVLTDQLRVTGGNIDWDPVPYNSFLGAYNDDNENYTFDGQLDDVGVWDRALTQEEIDWIYNNGIGNALPGQPLIPTPANRAELVDCEQDLSWELVWDDITVLGYDLYFGTDPNVADNPKKLSNVLVNTYEPGLLARETTYYWRVDIIEPNDLGGTNTIKGRDWYFTTCPSQVVITGQPLPQVVKIGAAGQLNVVALNAASYQWYKEPAELIVDGPDISGAQTDTLTVGDFQLADEARYYCVIQGIEGDTAETDHVVMLAAKLVGHFPMDGDILDYSGLGNDGTFNGDPNFVPGIAGSSALVLDGTEYVVIDPVADDIPTNDITLSGWVKTTDQWADWLSFHTADYANVAMFEIWDGYANLYEGVSEAWSTTFVADDQWHMLTYTRVGSVGSTYVDGTLEATHTPNFNLSPDDRWTIGQEWDDDVPSDFLTGLVDDVRIYNYGMDAYEVAALYLDVKSDGYACIGQPLQMDRNRDCRVDIEDFATVAADWIVCNLVPTCLP